MKTLLKNTNYGCIGITDDTITYIGDELPKEHYDLIKDMSGKLIIPGFYNTHCHVPMTLMRGYGNDLPLEKWLFDMIFPMEDRFRPEDFRVGAALGILEMLASGIVSFSDMYFHCDEILKPVIESGIKINIARSVQSIGDSEFFSDNMRVKDACRIYDDYNGCENGKVKVDFSVHAVYTCTEDVVRGLSEECLKRGAHFQTHMSETKKERDDCLNEHGKTPVRWFYDLGVFNNPTSAAHCVWIDDDDISIIKENSVHPVHCPSSNMKLGSGFSPVQKMLDNGIIVGLGTDGASSNNNLNMFTEMRLASLIHSGYELNSESMKSSDVVKMATVNGAIIQGRTNCGSIEVGKKADLVAIDSGKPHLYPNLDNDALLCYSAYGSDVSMTMVDGRILYENGEYMTLDKEKILYDVKKSIEYLYK